MFIYQDYEIAQDKIKFIYKTITEFKASEFYYTATEAESYYNGQNATILKRMQWFYNSVGNLQEDKFKANNRIANEFLPTIVKQEASYLLANGLTTDDNIKDELGNKFDKKLINGATNAIISGVSWGYCYINHKGAFNVDMWKGTEVVPLHDERTGAIIAVIRFWQLKSDRPLYVEFYDIQGKTELIYVDGEGKVSQEHTPYKIKAITDALGTEYVGDGGFSVLPIFPIYANDRKGSILTVALKSKLDLYDIILSDFGNNLEDSQDVYWVLKNYNGQDMGEFLADYKYYKSIKVDEDGDAQAHTIDVPYQARQVALDLLRKEIYESSMALDTSVLSGGSLTNIAIKCAMVNLDLKTDDLEMGVAEFVTNVIDLLMEYKNQTNTKYEIEFIRRSIINDTEIIDNIYKMRSDISTETALRLNPYIINVDEEIKLLDGEAMFKLAEEPETDEEQTQGE